MNRCEPSLLKPKTHTGYLCEIDGAPSEEKWFESAQHHLSKKALLVFAMFHEKKIHRKELQCTICVCNFPLVR